MLYLILYLIFGFLMTFGMAKSFHASGRPFTRINFAVTVIFGPLLLAVHISWGFVLWTQGKKHT